MEIRYSRYYLILKVNPHSSLEPWGIYYTVSASHFQASSRSRASHPQFAWYNNKIIKISIWKFKKKDCLHSHSLGVPEGASSLHCWLPSFLSLWWPWWWWWWWWWWWCPLWLLCFLSRENIIVITRLWLILMSMKISCCFWSCIPINCLIHQSLQTTIDIFSC